MSGTIDTYFEAWNETDDAARRALTETSRYVEFSP
jgi:hypothetical protein